MARRSDFWLATAHRISTASALLAAALTVAACGTLPPRGEPGIVAMRDMGKSLPVFEMAYGAPLADNVTNGVHVATWHMEDPYHMAGVCNLTVRTTPAGIIDGVSWTRGCGPKRAASASQKGEAQLGK